MAQKINSHVILNGLFRKICLICMHVLEEEADSQRDVGGGLF